MLTWCGIGDTPQPDERQETAWVGRWVQDQRFCSHPFDVAETRTVTRSKVPSEGAESAPGEAPVIHGLVSA